MKWLPPKDFRRVSSRLNSLLKMCRGAGEVVTAGRGVVIKTGPRGARVDGIMVLVDDEGVEQLRGTT